MTYEPEDLVFRARALAQAHPLTPLASRFLNRAVAQEGIDQPFPEIGAWAGSALVDGYCLRRVEEAEGDVDAVAAVAAGATDGLVVDPVDALALLDERASHIASDLRAGPGTGCSYLEDENRTIAALDRLVASAVERRLDNLREDIDEGAWGELGEYLAWWVVKGYALRVAEC